jgi:hypothetical protein
MIEKKYCSSCCIYRDATGGKLIKTANKNVKRWKCLVCISRTNAKESD